VDSDTGDFYRYRYSVFGGTDCPALQQHMARVLLRVLNRAGKTHGWPDAENTAVFMDDGHGVLPAHLTLEEATRQYTAMMDFMNWLGVADSAKKRVAPCKIKSYIGFTVDSEEQVVRPEAKKVTKYTALLDELEARHSERGELRRKEFASLVGKMQHVAPVVRGGQQLLREAYVARDHFVSEEDRQRPWSEDTRVWVHPQAWGELRALARLLPTARRRYYLDGEHEENGFFTGFTAKTHEQMDATSRAHADIPVVTTDASGTAGGGHCEDYRFIHTYEPELCAPLKSSNFREFHTGLVGIERCARRFGWRDRRVLWRTDNTTARSIANRQGTMSSELAGISAALQELCRETDLDVAAMHIPGEENGLADRLSRFRWEHDRGDWRVADVVFAEASKRVGRDFTLDGSADPVGSNAHCARFKSAVDSFFDADLSGEDLWSNPDFDIILDYLRHFKRAYERSPHDTSGTFLVPVWPWADWWWELRGAKVLMYFEQGQRLFTSPDWRRNGHGRPEGRVDRGPTRWPVVVVHFPRALDCRARAAGAASGGGGRGARADGAAAPLRSWPTLRGDKDIDDVLLRGLRPTSVHELHETPRQTQGRH